MGQKVAKIKTGIQKGLVINVEFLNDTDPKGKISGQDVVDLINCMIQSGNVSVKTFTLSGDCLTDDVATNLGVLLNTWNSTNVPARKKGSLGLFLHNSEFSSTGVKAIFNALAECDIIGRLAITGTYKPLDETVIEALDQSLHKNKTLEALSLGGFAVTPQITKAFVTCMSKQRTIKSLTLSRWELRPDDCTTLLSGFHNLEYLDVSRCEIGNEGCKALSTVLGKGPLTQLILDENNISNKGAEYILDLLVKENTCNLQKLSFEGNDIDNDDLLKIIEGELAKRRASDKRKYSHADTQPQQQQPELSSSVTSPNSELVKEKLVNQVFQVEVNNDSSN